MTDSVPLGEITCPSGELVLMDGGPIVRPAARSDAVRHTRTRCRGVHLGHGNFPAQLELDAAGAPVAIQVTVQGDEE